MIFLVDNRGGIVAVDARAIEQASDRAIETIRRTHFMTGNASEAWAAARRRIRGKEAQPL